MRARAKILSVIALVASFACGSAGLDAPTSSGSAAPAANASADADADASPPEPSITRLAFFRGAGTEGPRILARGTDVGARLSTLHIELLGADGELARIDPGEGGELEANEVDVSVEGGPRADEGAFSVEIRGASGLDASVHAVRVRAIERSGNTGPAILAVLENAPERADSETCDAPFETCRSGSVCTPQLPEQTSRCQPAGPVRAGKCEAATALELSPGGGRVMVQGRARGVSLWDPPEGCAPPERLQMPEGVVRLHVTTPTKSLTLTTASDKTSFDTVVYVLSGCAESGEAALACNDDVVPPTSTVHLANVEPGEYVVIVDALAREGGTFELTATIP